MSTEGMPGFNLVDLPTADLGDKLKTVQRDDSAALALTIMIADDFWQVPVVSGKRKVVGAVTWRSLACRNVQDDTTAGDVCEPIPGGAPFPLTTPVVDVLELVSSSDFVLTHDGTNELCGIVTASDMTLWAKRYCRAFLAVDEMERHLRDTLSNVDPVLLDGAPPSATANGGATDGAPMADSWTFSLYRDFFDSDDVWRELPREQLWSRIDHSEFRRRLREANEARNRAFHFRTGGDAPTAEARATERESDADLLAQFARCLRIITGG
ncbi:MAG: hypothetical protein F4004_03920 [Acidimicrobiia bacterium]|nr:hypothetical protein [Acidimicrobiia bacterium]MYC43945.1 hypothetical protein [Acidimicrobiia bacterium]